MLSNRVKIKHNFRVDEIKSISPDIEIVELTSDFFRHYKIHTTKPSKSTETSYINAGHALLASIPDTVKKLVFDDKSAMIFGAYYYGIIIDVLKEVTSPHVTIYVNHKEHDKGFELLRQGVQAPVVMEWGEKPSMLQFLTEFGSLAISHRQKSNIQVIPTPHQINSKEFVAPAAATPAPLRVRPLNKKRRALCEEKKISMVKECVDSLITSKKKEVDAHEIFKRFLGWSNHFYKKADEAATGKSRPWKMTENKENVSASRLSSEEDRRQCVELAESMANETLDLIKNHPALQGKEIQFVNTQRMVTGDEQDFSREQSYEQRYRLNQGVKCGGSQPRLDQITLEPSGCHELDHYVLTLFNNAPKPAPIPPAPNAMPAETSVPQPLQAGFARFHSGKAPLDGVRMSRKPKPRSHQSHPAFHVNLTHLPDLVQEKIKGNEMAKLKNK